MSSKMPPLRIAVPFFLGGFVALWMLSGQNPGLSLLSITALVVCVPMLWRAGESMILLLIFTVQWLQASVKLFKAQILDVPLASLTQFGGNIERAVLLSLVAIMVLSFGMRIGMGKRRSMASETQTLTKNIELRKIYLLYFCSALISFAALSVALASPGFYQLLLPLSALKWAAFFVLTYSVFSRSSSRKSLWLIVFACELLIGLGGYFSSFKTVFFFAILAVLAARPQWTFPRFILVTGLSIILLYFITLWIAVKDDYRSYVNAGSGQQVVLVEFNERLAYLGNLVVNVDGRKIADAVGELVDRVSYVDIFGSTLNNVPAAVSHTNGVIWLDALVRPFMPRLLFPEKSVIDDSRRTNEFSGVRFAGAESGTSVSIGYVGESYIDFGAYGMMFIIFAYGWLLGRIYRWLSYEGATRGLLGVGLATSGLFGTLLLESSITKVFGGLVATMIVYAVLRGMFATRLMRWLCAGEQRRASVVRA